MATKKGGKRIARSPVASVVKDGKTTQKAKPARKFTSEPAEIRIDLGATLNMGNYESLRIGISLSVPCPNTKTGIESAFKASEKYVEAKLDKLIKKHRGPESDTNDDALIL